MRCCRLVELSGAVGKVEDEPRRGWSGVAVIQATVSPARSRAIRSATLRRGWLQCDSGD